MQTTVSRRTENRPPKNFRGSRRRLSRIRLRGNGAWDLWFLIAWVAFLLFFVVPRLIQHNR